MTPPKTRPHKPMLAEWTCEILSLSLGSLANLSLQVRRNVTGFYLEGLSGANSQPEAALEASQVHDLMAACLVVLSSALYDSGCGHTQSPVLLCLPVR